MAQLAQDGAGGPNGATGAAGADGGGGTPAQVQLGQVARAATAQLVQVEVAKATNRLGLATLSDRTPNYWVHGPLRYHKVATSLSTLFCILFSIVLFL